jgi:hypothetical protein
MAALIKEEIYNLHEEEEDLLESEEQPPSHSLPIIYLMQTQICLRLNQQKDSQLHLRREYQDAQISVQFPHIFMSN